MIIIIVIKLKMYGFGILMKLINYILIKMKK